MASKRHSTSVNGPLVLAAAMVLTLALGSVHAFSVFLQPMEQVFAASRAEVSFTYSAALVCLTLAVLTGHLVFGALRPALFALAACSAAAVGCIIASLANGLWGVWLGYSILFGAANGFGYGYALQIAAQANPQNKAFAMGITTAAYALGAAVFPSFLDHILTTAGIALALQALALVVIAAGIVAAGLLHVAKARFATATTAEVVHGHENSTRLLAHLWFAYGAGVSAGLMVIGHATGLATNAGAAKNLVVLAPVFVAVGNMAGGVLAGWATDTLGSRWVLTVLPVLTLCGLTTLLISAGPLAALTALGLIGFSYGAIIAVYPAVISYLFGTLHGIRAYGRVFTAWGAAGLIFPWLAGYLFDHAQTYTTILIVAAVISGLSAVFACRLPPAHAERT
ncbi:MAG: hypothetical protein HKN05_06970 [Rhizobiales bacterium]|nr:hypothetical protein [Hyphomicrobiales bacterium]